MSLSFAIIGCRNIAKRHDEQIQALENWWLFVISLDPRQKSQEKNMMLMYFLHRRFV
jgi:hypothetical protein